jgi:hypothetical protein
MDIAQLKPNFIPEPGLASGWGSFAFHPDFYKNGLLYTTHTEKKGWAPADYAYADSIPVALQWVVTEWQIKDPTAVVFEPTPREMLRVNMPSPIHGMQQICGRRCRSSLTSGRTRNHRQGGLFFCCCKTRPFEPRINCKLNFGCSVIRKQVTV